VSLSLHLGVRWNEYFSSHVALLPRNESSVSIVKNAMWTSVRDRNH
jgi:hypothetical protein